jgi:hypothetical protein
MMVNCLAMRLIYGWCNEVPAMMMANCLAMMLIRYSNTLQQMCNY